MNTELAEQIIGIILHQPERFAMRAFFENYGESTAGDVRTEWPCGTTACIAGHAAILTVPAGTVLHNGLMLWPDGTMRAMSALARDELGLDDDVAAALFFQVTDDEAIPALMYLIANPDASSEDLLGFLHGTLDFRDAPAVSESSQDVSGPADDVAADWTDDMLPVLAGASHGPA